jgi:hypothetical protein
MGGNLFLPSTLEGLALQPACRPFRPLPLTTIPWGRELPEQVANAATCARQSGEGSDKTGSKEIIETFRHRT